MNAERFFSPTECFLARVAVMAKKRGVENIEFTFRDLGDHIHIYGVNAYRNPGVFLNNLIRRQAVVA